MPGRAGVPVEVASDDLPLVRDPAEVKDDELLQVRVAGGRLPVRVDRSANQEDSTP